MTLDEVWNIEIDKRWLPVYYIQGKRTNFYHDFFYKRNCLRELIMRFDSLFTNANGFHGNNYSIEEFYRKESGMTDALENNKLDEWYKWWASDNYNEGYGLFVINLISSCNLRGSWSWFNPKTGKIGASNYLEYVDTLGDFKEELEWFVSEFEEFDMYLSFATDKENDTPTVTLHLHDGKIEVVPTIKKFPKNNGYYSKRATLKYKLLRKFYKFIKKHFKHNQKSVLAYHLWEEYVMYHNVGSMLHLYKRESYFKSVEQVRYLIDWWKEKCRWYANSEEEK